MNPASADNNNDMLLLVDGTLEHPAKVKFIVLSLWYSLGFSNSQIRNLESVNALR